MYITVLVTIPTIEKGGPYFESKHTLYNCELHALIIFGQTILIELLY